jgi:hypothetical protein
MSLTRRRLLAATGACLAAIPQSLQAASAFRLSDALNDAGFGAMPLPADWSACLVAELRAEALRRYGAVANGELLQRIAQDHAADLAADRWLEGGCTTISRTYACIQAALHPAMTQAATACRLHITSQ